MHIKKHAKWRNNNLGRKRDKERIELKETSLSNNPKEMSKANNNVLKITTAETTIVHHKTMANAMLLEVTDQRTRIDQNRITTNLSRNKNEISDLLFCHHPNSLYCHIVH